MTRTRCTLAILIAFAITAKASAQIIIGMPITIPNGIDFRYRSGGLRVNGFIPTGGPGYLVPATYYPYSPYNPSYAVPIRGVIEQRVIVRVMPPPVVIVRRTGPDLSGIDLDVEPASKIWGEKPVPAKKSEKIGEGARIVPPEEKKAPPIVVNPAKPPMPPAPPKPEIVPESKRLTDLGFIAFRAGEYNVAILRFRQVAEGAPVAVQPLFLEAQALIAVGKYRHAVELIEQGLKRMPNWPASGFRPKVDLYDNDEAVWIAHRKQIEQAQRANPKTGDYVFLLGYLAWFDGDRDLAADYFNQARVLAADSGFSDLFLKVAKK